MNCCDYFELVEFVETFDMGINFLVGSGGGGGGTSDYSQLTNKPKINGVTLSGNKTTADLGISFTKSDVGLGNVDNVRQYSASNPPPYPVTSVNGQTGDVVVQGGGGTSDYADLTNKPSINGVTLSGNKTTADLGISFTKSDVGLGNVDNVRQYSASNPPPYPVTSVNGQTGDVVVQGGGGADPATADPLMDGTAAVGVSTKYAREDHVHPSDTSRATKADFTAFPVTLAAASWASNQQTVSNAAFFASGYAYIVSPASASFAAYGEAEIYADNVGTSGQMTFHCVNVPSADLTVNIVRVVSA